MRRRGGSGHTAGGSADRGAGLFRAALGGPGATLAEAFAAMERVPTAGLLHHPLRDLAAVRLDLTPQEGSGYVELTRIKNDAYVIVCNFAYKDPRLELVPGDGLIQFYFKLSGDLTLGVSRTEPLRLNRPSLLVYNQPPGVDLQEWTAPSSLERAVAITLKPEFLVDHFLRLEENPSPQLQALAAGEPGRLKYVQLPITAEMFELATRLVENRHSGAARLVYTEAIVLQMLCATTAGFNKLSTAPNEEYSERDLRCLNAARDFLMTHLSPAPTIRHVARAAGMSETALKHAFKAVFGETVFEYSVRCRMQHALRMLRERRGPVSRIAEAVGYAHQTSFATAFRRHFGVAPRYMRPAKTRCQI